MQGYLIQEMGDGSGSGWDPVRCFALIEVQLDMDLVMDMDLLEFDSLRIIQIFFL